MPEFQDGYHEGIWKVFLQGMGIGTPTIQSIIFENGYLTVKAALNQLLIVRARWALSPDGTIKSGVAVVCVDTSYVDGYVDILWANNLDPLELGQNLREQFDQLITLPTINPT